MGARVTALCAVAVVLAGLAGCSAGTANVAAPQITVTVTGASSVRLGGQTQFAATVANTTNTAVTWQVNGAVGGNAIAGTISASGLYAPPATIPSPNTVTVTAVSLAQPGVSGSEVESILNPTPVVTSAYATLTLGTSYSLDVVGTGFVTASQIQANGVGVATTFVSATELTATITVAAGVTTVPVDVVNPNPGTLTSSVVNATVTQTTIAQAARLLDQATWGPTLNDIGHVQQVGINGYLNEQFAMPTTLLADIPATLPVNCVSSNTPIPCEESEWWQAVLTGNDQLRQRVAFALSEMLVVSSVSASVNARSITPYHNMLANDAFGNYYTILHDVTLSPAMGAYLNMINSDKAPTGQIPNENYARELMQLFSIGLYALNQDGSVQLDGSGNPIPTYTEAQVQQFAKVYTGWTFSTATGGVPTAFPNGPAQYFYPMAAVESHHDMTAKTLLNGTVLPAGQSSTQDLQGALTNIFNHPNVGPFVCKQLIQHLVASNPSPAYVARVAAVFANDGTGVRGNMKAVIKAILTDVDARAGDTSPNFDGGHLREPLLWMTGVMRGLGYVNTDANQNYYSLSNYAGNLNERPYRAGSVFNFFSNFYVLPGTTTAAPEFGLENTATAILRLSLADSFVFNKISGFHADLSATSTLGVMATGVNGPGNLADSLSVIFLHGQMPASMRTTIVNAVSGLTDPAQRVRVATYLVITSSLYKVEH